MLEKLSGVIVKRRRAVLILFLLLTVVCAFMINKAVINYDFTVYLSESTVTRRSLDIMEEEFGANDVVALMFTDLPEGKAEAINEELNDMPEVMRAVYSEETDRREKDGAVYERINVYVESPDAVGFVSTLRDKYDSDPEIGEFVMSGSAPQTLLIEEKILGEIPLAMGIAVIIVIAVLLLTSHSWIEPLIFIIVLLVSIVINMGTNFIFNSISFVTFAVAAILQLALAMDYSIMLLHSFFEIRDSGATDEEALKLALTRSFMPISSSSLTTVAGLVSLMFMSFTIGFDIGIVLSKGIIISMLTVFTLMPALIMLFRKPLRTTMHKVLPLGGGALARVAVKGRRIIPFVLILAIAAGFVVQQKYMIYSFSDDTLKMENNAVSRVFGMSNQLVLLLPAEQKDEDFDKQREFIAELKQLETEGHKAVTDVTAMVTTGEQAIKYYTLDEMSELVGVPKLALSMYMGAMGFSTTARGDELIDKAASIMTENETVQELKSLMDFAKRMFISDNYARLILLLDAGNFGEAPFRLLDEISELLNKYYPNEKTGIVGNLMSSYDISEAFTADTLKVNLITIAAIFVILLLSFRKLTPPLILLPVIQGAVWINMAISGIMGTPVFFMCYLICLAIQMGATIDYGILLTSNYIHSRESLDKHEALSEALRLSMPTILTSGLILVAAGAAIGYTCSVYYIYSIGRMLARGTIASLVMVLFLLPPLLLSTDRFLIKRKRISE